MKKKEEFFNIKDNAKQWPSNNSIDRPSITYICKLCGKEICIPYNSMAEPSAIDKHVESHYLRYKGVIE